MNSRFCMVRLYRDIRKYWNYLIYATKAQLKSEVTNSYLDWVWWILEPFCNMIVYAIVFGVIFRASEANFPLFIFTGIVLWRFFSMTMNGSVSIIKGHKAVVTKVYVPKQILLLILMFENGFKTILSFAVIGVMMILYRVPVTRLDIIVLPALILLFILTYGFSCIVMHFGVYIEDLRYIINIGLTMLMYFTGTFYSIENRMSEPYSSYLLHINPFAYIINITRGCLLYHVNKMDIYYLIWLAIGIILSIIGTRLIYKNENSYVKVL